MFDFVFGNEEKADTLQMSVNYAVVFFVFFQIGFFVNTSIFLVSLLFTTIVAVLSLLVGIYYKNRELVFLAPFIGTPLPLAFVIWKTVPDGHFSATMFLVSAFVFLLFIMFEVWILINKRKRDSS